MLFTLIHLHGNSMCPFTSCAKRLHTEPSISILVSPSHISNCVTPALLLNGCRYANSETFASICLSFVLYDSIWWGNSEWIGIHVLCETICFPAWCIGVWGVGMVKSILSSINVSTLRPPEGAGEGFFVVPSSDRRPAAIWLILVHEFTSESLHGFPDPRPQVRNISSGVQSLSSGSTLTWAPNLIGCTRSIF